MMGGKSTLKKRSLVNWKIKTILKVKNLLNIWKLNVSCSITSRRFGDDNYLIKLKGTLLLPQEFSNQNFPRLLMDL